MQAQTLHLSINPPWGKETMKHVGCEIQVEAGANLKWLAGEHMLSGIQEILVIVLILLAILFIPRMMSPKRPQKPKPKAFQPLKRIKGLGVRWRIAIVVSLLWLLGAAVYCRPWQSPVEMYLLLGVGPVILGWCVSWVVAGIRPRRKT
jgi:hypothetical protein